MRHLLTCHVLFEWPLQYVLIDLTFRDKIFFESKCNGRFSGTRQAREPDGATPKRSSAVQLLTPFGPSHFVLLLEHVCRPDLGQARPRPLQSFVRDLHDSIC